MSTATVRDAEEDALREATRRAELTQNVRIFGLAGDEECGAAMGVYVRQSKRVGRGSYVLDTGRGEWFELAFEGVKWAVTNSKDKAPVMYVVDAAQAPCHVGQLWRVRNGNGFRVSEAVRVEAVAEGGEDEGGDERAGRLVRGRRGKGQS